MAENKFEAVKDELTAEDVKKENAALSDADMKEVSGGSDVRVRVEQDDASEGSGCNDWRKEGPEPLWKEGGDK